MSNLYSTSGSCLHVQSVPLTWAPLYPDSKPRFWSDYVECRIYKRVVIWINGKYTYSCQLKSTCIVFQVPWYLYIEILEAELICTSKDWTQWLMFTDHNLLASYLSEQSTYSSVFDPLKDLLRHESCVLVYQKHIHSYNLMRLPFCWTICRFSMQ